MWFLEPEQLFIMPPAASPATSLLSLFILTFLHRPSTSCCHTERSRTGNAAHYPETNACYTTKVTQLPLLCDLIHAKIHREKNDFCKKKLWKADLQFNVVTENTEKNNNNHLLTLPLLSDCHGLIMFNLGIITMLALLLLWRWKCCSEKGSDFVSQ